MAKSFFKVYVETKKDIMQRKERYLIKEIDLSCTSFDALDKYLNQYTWVRREDEKICFDFCEDDISLEEVAEMNDMSYNTLRSMNSRVSARLYKRFGYDFKEIILGTDDEKKNWLISRCDASVDAYMLNEHYSDGLLSTIAMQTDDVVINSLDDFKIIREDLITLKFLADLDYETISERLELIDTERLAVICHILSNKRYYDERCEILSMIKNMKKKETPYYWRNDIDVLRGIKPISDNQ